jgi:diamine N-acetyltransferase
MEMHGCETTPPTPARAVTLRPITIETVGDICELAVAPEQSAFVAANAFSLAQAYCIPEAWPRAIYAGDTPVGFLMLHDDPAAQEYYLWRFMIDARSQGHGYGRAALERVIDYVRTRPGARFLTVAVVPKPGGPGPFYEKLGFRYTGEEKHGELRMELAL